jgi:hypothetical protein
MEKSQVSSSCAHATVGARKQILLESKTSTGLSHQYSKLSYGGVATRGVVGQQIEKGESRKLVAYRGSILGRMFGRCTIGWRVVGALI